MPHPVARLVLADARPAGRGPQLVRGGDGPRPRPVHRTGPGGRPGISDRPRGEPRVAALALLLYGSQTMAAPDLEVPHPRMHLRRFVLVPLVELDPDLMHPALGIRIGDLLTRLPGGSDVRVTVRDWFGAGASKRDVP